MKFRTAKFFFFFSFSTVCYSAATVSYKDILPYENGLRKYNCHSDPAKFCKLRNFCENFGAANFRKSFAKFHRGYKNLAGVEKFRRFCEISQPLPNFLGFAWTSLL